METYMKSQARGFSLMELMITVVIIGILAGLAYPAYQRHIQETRRSDAHNALSQVVNDLEKFYSECSVYTSNLTATPRSCTVPGGGTLGRGANANLSMNQYYQLTIDLPGVAGVPAGGYRITATTRAAAAQANDTTCATLSIDSTGTRRATKSDASDSSGLCWKR
jgi:type IV pilus assembly protein PilE